MNIGGQIKRVRIEKGVTQAEIAQRAKMSRTYLADVEAGRYNPSYKKLQDIAQALMITIGLLIADEDIQELKAENDVLERRLEKAVETLAEFMCPWDTGKPHYSEPNLCDDCHECWREALISGEKKAKSEEWET